jgi:predicted HTH transcriptional regulator
VIEEAIVNAVAHRDYGSTGSVQVMLFADRLEIRNLGQLPPALTIEMLKHDHASYPRNPLIAETLYYAKYIEKMGTGIQDMVRLCMDYGLPAPEFTMKDGFVATIYRKQNMALEKTGGQTGGMTGGMTLTDIQYKIINLIKENPKISYKKMSEILGVNISAIQKHIDKLKQAGVIKRKGADFGGYWIISNL